MEAKSNGSSHPIITTGFIVMIESTAPIEANDVLDALYQWSHRVDDVLTVNVEVFNIGG